MEILRHMVEYCRLPSNSRSVSNVWINEDIRPLPPHRRTWTRWAYVSFWAINQMTLSNFQLGASLVTAGLAVWQAVIATIIGKIIIAGVAVSNGYVGAEWHIGFPVVSRYIWGMYGHYIALIQRIILSLVWFAVQSWTGGLCVQNILAAIFPSYQHMGNHFPASANLNTKQFIGWIVFNVLMVPILYIRPERLQWVVLGFNAVTAVTLISMVIWVMTEAGGGGPLLDQPATALSSWDLGWSMVHGVTTVIGGIAVGLTNQMDYSRFARRPGDQVMGQWLSIIVLGIIMPSLGCLSASASQEVYGEAIWNPPNLVQKWLDTSYTPRSRAAAFFAGCGLVICQLAINSIDNAFSAGMDMAGLFPAYINIRRGAYIGLVLSIAMCPWQLLSAASTFISVLSAYSVFLGPMVGIMVCDYWMVRRRRVRLSDLYHPGKDGIYYFWHGVNWRAFAAWALGWSYLLPGFAHAVTPRVKVPEACTNLYYLAFPLGFAVSFSLHYIFNKVFPPKGLGEADDVDYYGTFTPDEAAKLRVALPETIEGKDGVEATSRPSMTKSGMAKVTSV
ncbi:Putative purine-cytosine permease [Septoria linicola]|uniref:Purine-cytosine permease n=1 Tax=Septoria linicola TaxID=215465 RepID=A0A9Q9EPH7_9PEZI|nr:putative purine-cytosine permease, uracil/uridine/allantoin permease [Septoria linicola]USW56538.1 Putative purine-cytosine permease [Septoria linicola]